MLFASKSACSRCAWQTSAMQTNVNTKHIGKILTLNTACCVSRAIAISWFHSPAHIHSLPYVCHIYTYWNVDAVHGMCCRYLVLRLQLCMRQVVAVLWITTINKNTKQQPNGYCTHTHETPKQFFIFYFCYSFKILLVWLFTDNIYTDCKTIVVVIECARCTVEAPKLLFCMCVCVCFWFFCSCCSVHFLILYFNWIPTTISRSKKRRRKK